MCGGVGQEYSLVQTAVTDISILISRLSKGPSDSKWNTRKDFFFKFEHAVS